MYVLQKQCLFQERTRVIFSTNFSAAEPLEEAGENYLMYNFLFLLQQQILPSWKVMKGFALN